MAWNDIPAKLAAYSNEKYAPEDAVRTLLNEFNADTHSSVEEHRRDEFEEQLDHRLGACKNLAVSKAVRPK